MEKRIVFLTILGSILLFSGIQNTTLLYTNSESSEIITGTSFTIRDYFDPTMISWDHYSADSYEEFLCADIDSSENLYVAGIMTNTTSRYSLVVKFDSNMNEIWNATNIIGSQDTINDISVDSSGKIYVAGNQYSGSYPNYIGVIYGFTSTGSLVYFYYVISGFYNQILTSVETYGSDEFVTCGYGTGSVGYFEHTILQRNFFGVTGTNWSNDEVPYQKFAYFLDMELNYFGDILVVGSVNGSSNQENIYIAQYSSSMGGQIWNNTLFEGSGNDQANVVKATSNNIYVGGEKYSYSIDSFRDGYLAKLDLNGNVLWNRTYDYNGVGNSDESIHSLIVTDSENIVVSGFDAVNSFIAEYSTSGDLVWNKTIDANTIQFEDTIYKSSTDEVITIGTLDRLGEYDGGIYILDYHAPQNDANSGGDAGDDFNNALSVSPGTYSGSIFNDDTNDWYQFTANTGDEINITLTGDAGTDFDLWLDDPSGTSVDSSTELSYPDFISYEADASGNWRVLVNKITGEGDYTLTITVTSPSTSTPPSSTPPPTSTPGFKFLEFLVKNWFWFVTGAGVLIILLVVLITALRKRKRQVA